MYYGDYQFDWLCVYTVVLLGTSITSYNRLVCTIIMFTGVLVMHTTWHKNMPFTNLYICIRLPYSYIKQAAATLETRPASLYAFDTTKNINNIIFLT